MSNSNKVSVKEGISLKPAQGYLEETVPPFTPFLAMEEASRCLLCYNPPCSEGCPADTNPGDFIRAIRFRNFKGAAEIIRSNNILGGVCARVCPFEKTCEAGCERSDIDKPISIFFWIIAQTSFTPNADIIPANANNKLWSSILTLFK